MPSPSGLAIHSAKPLRTMDPPRIHGRLLGPLSRLVSQSKPRDVPGRSLGSIRVAAGSLHHPDGFGVVVDQVPDTSAPGDLDLPLLQHPAVK